MSSNKEPIEIIELELDYCSLTFGSSPCTASLAGDVDRKCFNTFYTCKDQGNYSRSSITYRFVAPRQNYPKGATTFPCLVSVSGSSAQANIAGADDELYSLGKRGKITATFVDFPYHDRFMDKYQSERISGSAQLSGVGYQPKDKGTFWTKFKARNPNYAGRPMRKLTGYIQDGVLTIEKTRNFVITEIKGPDSNGRVTVEGKDILKLADNDKAVAPAQSSGKLDRSITNAVGQSFTLNPSGSGADYPAEGYAAIGSELVYFTRSTDWITLTQRGISGTTAASHSVDDTFQISYSPRQEKIHDVIYDLLTNYAGIDTSFITYADWAEEVNRWAPNIFLNTDILKPEGVADLIGEIMVLGVTVWWDDVNQKIRLKMNRPVDTDTVYSLSDTSNIISASQSDMDDKRLTEVIFNTVQNDVSRGVSEENFLRGFYLVSAVEKTDDAFGDTKIKRINCRWLNSGNEQAVKVITKRLLNRFKVAPRRHVVTVDYRDDLSIADVVELTSDAITSDTGELQTEQSQVIMREDVREGHSVRLTLQRFVYDQRYAFITENTRPVYASSTDAQKARGAYLVDEGTLLFGDGQGPYLFS